MIGQTLGHYRVVERIGAGGMGEVYRAHDQHLERDVALKILPAGILRDESVRKRFRREALALSKLNHPNIATVFDFATQDGVDFLAMELIRGATLSERVNAGPIADKEVFRLGIQFIEGLAAAHAEGVIHRDLKPGNLMITSDGRLKILDFGLAALVQPEADPDVTRSLAETGTVSGTLPYMSPEQLRGQPPDTRSDIYSAGAVLYEMIAGRRAFPQSQTAELIGAILHDTPAPPSGHNRRITPALESVVMKTLEKEPARRYQSAREFLVALEGLGTGVAPAAVRPQQHWLAVAAGAALVFVLLIGMTMRFNVGGWRDRLLHRGMWGKEVARAANAPVQARRSVAVLSFKNLSGRPDEAWLSTALSEMLMTELAAGEHLRMIPGENVAQMKVSLSLADADSYSKETLSRIRANLGTDNVVLGSYVPLGSGQIRLDLRLQDAVGGEILATVSAKGSETQIDDLVSGAGAVLRQKLGAGEVSATQAVAVKATLPSNPVAARLYSEGLAKLRVFEAFSARDLLEKAVAADPEYSLAHSALAAAWSEMGYDEKAKREAKRALDLSANLLREDRLSIEGRYRGISHEWPQAVEVYRTLWGFFPDNLDYGYALAMAQNSARQPRDALVTVGELRRLPPPARDDPRIDHAEFEAAALQGDFKRMQTTAARAAEKGAAEGARLLVARARVRECWAFEKLGQPGQASASCEDGRRIYTSAGNQVGLARTLNNIGILHLAQGDYAGARKALEEALTIYRKIGKKDGVATVLSNIGNLLQEQGKLFDATRMYQQVLDICRETGDKQSAAIALTDTANARSRMGDLVGAKEAYEEALALERQIGNRNVEAMALNNLASTLCLLGELGTAKTMLHQAHAIMSEARNKADIVFVLSGEGDVAMAEGDLPEARRKYEEMLSTAKELGQKGNGAVSQVSLAQLSLDEGHAADASSMLPQAIETLQSEGQSDNELVARTTLAESLLTQGRPAEARKQLDQATRLVRKSQDPSTRFQFDLVAARIRARMREPAEAEKSLKATLAEAIKYGYVNYQFEARLALGEIEMKSGSTTAGRARLNALETDATAKEFLLIARKAATAQKLKD